MIELLRNIHYYFFICIIFYIFLETILEKILITFIKKTFNVKNLIKKSKKYNKIKEIIENIILLIFIILHYLFFIITVNYTKITIIIKTMECVLICLYIFYKLIYVKK
jgi:hypothetical protein